MFAQFVAWYLVVQLIAVAALPLALRLFTHLPDRGYALARVLGILLMGYIFWLAYSFGFVRYEQGGGWLAVAGMATISLMVGRPVLRNLRAQRPSRRGWAYVVAVELIFVLAFAAWAWVRAHDPAANHTEKPMDLMFMNSIRASATYPPMDAWLAGHPISYYYFGYWLLTSLGMLAGQPPEIAYNLGQACWYGLLLSTSFGVAYNLLAVGGRRFASAAAGGLLGAIWIGMAANLQGILEWLHANGVNVSGIAGLLRVAGFPQDAAVTNQWFVDYGWWWWRSSRVIEDLDLAGNHIEVIDEFPVFSYILGDNHPHVLAMPFVLLVIAMALNIFLSPRRVETVGSVQAEKVGDDDIVAELAPPVSPSWFVTWLTHVRDAMPLGWGGWLLTAIASGALLFLNTWDFPPYWLLLGITVGAVLWRNWPEERLAGAMGLAVVTMVGLLAAAVVLYLPYFLTAQSQAGGVVPNLFNPTRLGQFVAMFAAALLVLLALVALGWAELRPRVRHLATSFAMVLGLPILFLALSMAVVTATPFGQELLARMPLPPGESSHLAVILARWFGQPFTFLLTGTLLALVLALTWRGLTTRGDVPAQVAQPTMPFILVLAGIGLLLVYAPEFVFLRDNFGTRMNTIFKFYYQAWLLFGLAGSYTVVVALSRWRGWRLAPALLSSGALVLVLASTVYLWAGAYSKAAGFAATPTFDATAYLASFGPDELAAVQWVRDNTRPDAWVLESKGGSYRADHNRISTMTGRGTLLGWDGHEAQWRGRDYGAMAAGRPELLEVIYRSGTPAAIAGLVDQWGIDYVYVGPAERETYQITPSGEERLRAVMDLAFESGDVRIYRAR